MIQSIIFKRDYGVIKSRDWLMKYGFGSSKMDITPEYIRFRQYDPLPLERSGYQFRTQKFKHGYFIIAYLPTKKNK